MPSKVAKFAVPATALVTAGIVAGAVVLLGHSDGKVKEIRAAGTGPNVVTSTVDFGAGMTFVPTSGQPQAYSAPQDLLSAQGAFSRYAHGKSIPADDGYTEGVLNKTPMFSNQTVWLYTLQGPCDQGYSGLPIPTPASGCTTWSFVDATPGQQLLETSPPGTLAQSMATYSASN